MNGLMEAVGVIIVVATGAAAAFAALIMVYLGAQGWRAILWASLRRRILKERPSAACVACGERGGQPGTPPLMAVVRNPSKRNVWAHRDARCYSRAMKMLGRAAGKSLTPEAVAAEGFRG